MCSSAPVLECPFTTFGGHTPFVCSVSLTATKYNLDNETHDEMSCQECGEDVNRETTTTVARARPGERSLHHRLGIICIDRTEIEERCYCLAFLELMRCSYSVMWRALLYPWAAVERKNAYALCASSTQPGDMWVVFRGAPRQFRSRQAFLDTLDRQ